MILKSLISRHMPDFNLKFKMSLSLLGTIRCSIFPTTLILYYFPTTFFYFIETDKAPVTTSLQGRIYMNYDYFECWDRRENSLRFSCDIFLFLSSRNQLIDS